MCGPQAFALSLIDDLSSEAIERMKAEGFEPAIVVETSPNNFQAWLNHGQILDAAAGTRAAKQLAERFEGDPSSADWRHFGRLAGFTNPKRERQLPSGLRPFAPAPVSHRACLLEGCQICRRHPGKRRKSRRAG
jgi:RepB DNA-primase from phage plasmid